MYIPTFKIIRRQADFYGFCKLATLNNKQRRSWNCYSQSKLVVCKWGDRSGAIEEDTRDLSLGHTRRNVCDRERHGRSVYSGMVVVALSRQTKCQSQSQHSCHTCLLWQENNRCSKKIINHCPFRPLSLGDAFSKSTHPPLSYPHPQVRLSLYSPTVDVFCLHALRVR